LLEKFDIMFEKLRRSIPASLNHRFFLGGSAFFLAAFALNSAASATTVTLGTAASYGYFTGVNGATNLSGGFTVTGNAGVASGYNITASGTNTVTGTLYYDYTTGHGAYSNSGTFNQGGSVNTNLSQPVADATSAASNAAALSATAGLTDQGSSISVSGSSLTIKALTNLSENVLDISSLSLLNGTLTFDDNGFTGAKFIVNITGGFSVGSTGSGKSIIQGVNGASASDILFNVEGSGSSVSITGNSTNQLIGTILAPTSNVTIGGGGTLLGALVAGANSVGKAVTVTEQSSGFNITASTYKPQAVTKTPEPSSIALLATGLVAVGYWKTRRRRRLPSTK
jgi:hypothetical protein